MADRQKLRIIKIFTMTHKLKTISKFFEDVASGAKSFEIRFNDRNFQVGDDLFLFEFFPLDDRYSGRFLHVSVTYVMSLDSIFNTRNLVCMSIVIL